MDGLKERGWKGGKKGKIKGKMKRMMDAKETSKAGRRKDKANSFLRADVKSVAV